jgi:hypothetical protein
MYIHTELARRLAQSKIDEARSRAARVRAVDQPLASSRVKRAAASAITFSRLQNANRTSVRPASGSS